MAKEAAIGNGLFPAPPDALRVVGNRGLTGKLLRDVKDGCLSHAYIIEGPAGSGKHTVARWLCAAIACENRPNRADVRTDADQMDFFSDLLPAPKRTIPPDAPLPCGDCLPCRKVLEGNCPDVHVIGRDGKATLGVDQVRFLRQDVLISPNDLDTKIYIIEDAEPMTVQAQNALLPTREEPPPYVLFLLLCDGAEALLETIRSRAPTLHTQPIPDEDIRAYLTAHRRVLPENELAAVLLRAQGCIGQAMILSDAKAVKPILRMREQCLTFLTACADRQPDGILSAVNQFGTKRDGATDALGELMTAVRDLFLLKADEGVRLCWFSDRDAALELSDRFTSRNLLRLYEALMGALEALDGNGNVRLVLTQMCLGAGIL